MRPGGNPARCLITFIQQRLEFFIRSSFQRLFSTTNLLLHYKIFVVTQTCTLARLFFEISFKRREHPTVQPDMSGNFPREHESYTQRKKNRVNGNRTREHEV